MSSRRTAAFIAIVALAFLVTPARAFVTACSYPGGMYAGDADCKYAQARPDWRCTESHATTTGTACYEIQFLRFNYRGGTADDRSPKVTGTCLYHGQSDFKDWQLSYFTVYHGSVILYTASTAHYGIHTNCDVEAGPYYGSPVPFSFRTTSIAHFVFAHRCFAGTSCGTQIATIDFPMIAG
jgi:hypothetical protein